jgi:hypothetical protein
MSPLAAGISLGSYPEHVVAASDHPALSENVLLSWPGERHSAFKVMTCSLDELSPASGVGARTVAADGRDERWGCCRLLRDSGH